MDQIKVNTTELRISAQDLNSSANDINAVISQLVKNDISNAYSGQLKNAVTGIVSDAHPKAVKLQNQSWELRDELVLRADRFEAVNEAGSSAMINVSHQINGFIDGSPILILFGSISKSDLGKASLIWGLGGFGGLIGLIAILPRIWSIIVKRRVPPAPTPVPTPTPPKSETRSNSDEGKNQDQNTTNVSEAQLPKLGALSQKYESNGDPGRVSSGVGDPGGVSYGAYQMTSKGGGTVARFLKSDAASPWAS
ncbi:MAG: hypothetical protein GYA36_19990 [Veillonellaceae bacterium]|nr:hypothetical protein [Veillonellaceae bacterium]